MSDEVCDLKLTDEVSKLQNNAEECGIRILEGGITNGTDSSVDSVNVLSNLDIHPVASYSTDTSDVLKGNLSSEKEMSSDLAQNETLVNLSMCDEYTLYNTLKNIFSSVERNSEVKSNKDLETCSQFGLEESGSMQTISEGLSDVVSKGGLSSTDVNKSVPENVEIVSQIIYATEEGPNSVDPSNDANLSSSLNVDHSVLDSENCASALSNSSISSPEVSFLPVQSGNYSCEVSNLDHKFDVSTQCNTPDILGTIQYHGPTQREPTVTISRSVQCNIESENSVKNVHYRNTQLRSNFPKCSENVIVSSTQTSPTDTCYCCQRVFNSSDLIYLQRNKTKIASSTPKTNPINLQKRGKKFIHSDSAVHSVDGISKNSFLISSKTKSSEHLERGEEGKTYNEPQRTFTEDAVSEKIQALQNFRERDKNIKVSLKNKEKTSTNHDLFFNSLACERASSPENLDDELPLSESNCARFVEKILSTDYENSMSANLPKERSHQNAGITKQIEDSNGSKKTINVPECIVISDSDGEHTPVHECLVPKKEHKRKRSFSKRKNTKRRLPENLLESSPTSTLKNRIKFGGKKITSHRYSSGRRRDYPHQSNAHSSKTRNLLVYDSTSTEYSSGNSSPGQSDTEDSCFPSPRSREGKLVRENFTQSEREQILQYIINHRAYSHIKYDDFWKEMKAAGVCKRHSWMSMKRHFQTQLRFQIKSFNLGRKIEKKFYNIFQ